MILYFNTYISDTPLTPKKPAVDDVRTKSKIYSKPKQIDIVKYTLASYSVYPWSQVYIQFECEDKSLEAGLGMFIKEIFPNAIIENNRSNTKESYLRAIDTLGKMNDPWIFFSPNNDHPLLISDKSEIDYLEKMLKKAAALRSHFPYVSVIYSHLSEYYQASRPGSANYPYFGKDTTLIEEDDEMLVFTRPNGDFNSIQILHIETMRHIFNTTQNTDKPLRRLEDVTDVILKDHALLVPKKKLCSHFDGYEHMQSSINEISSDIEPVLFIPPGFFEGKIKIAYGFKENKPDYTNVNPCAKHYSFRDKKYGTDLKIALKEIPLFWKSHIEEIVVDPEVDHTQMNLCAKRHFEKIINPWSIKNLGFNLKNLKFQAKLFFRPILAKYGILSFVKNTLNKQTG